MNSKMEPQLMHWDTKQDSYSTVGGDGDVHVVSARNYFPYARP